MLSDRGLQYGLDVDQVNEDDEPLKIVSQIVTKDLTASSAHKSAIRHKQKSNQAVAYSDKDTDDEYEEEDGDGDGYTDADNVDDRDSQTNATDNERQSTLHLPHARWPNHWSDTAPSHMTAPAVNSVTYKWLTSPWSACSQKCGAAGSGLRVCMLASPDSMTS